jgi:ABC-type multidrug transport system fused ATPase/permease subunit
MNRDPRIQQAAQGLAAAISGGTPPTAGRLIRPLLAPWWACLTAGILFNALHGLAVAAQSLTPKWLISDILKPEDLTVEQRVHRLIALAAGYLVVTVVGRMMVWHIGFRFFTFVRERAVFALRATFFRHVNHLCLRFHGHHPSGELFNYLFGAPLAQVLQFYHHTSMSAPGAVFTLVSTLLMLGWWDPVLTAVLAATAGLNLLIMQHARRRIRKLNLDYQHTEGDVAGHAADLLRGSQAVKLYAMENTVAAQFEREAMRMGHHSYHRDVSTHVHHMKLEGAGYAGYAVLIAVAGWRYLGGHADEGVIAAYLNAFGGVMAQLTALATSVTLYGGAQASLERIGRVLATASTTPDPDPAVRMDPPTGGDITFRNVVFGYEPDRPPVLHHINLVIPRGQRIALVGPSGSGKSTLVQLLLRLYDPQQGTVKLDGVDLRRCRGEDLRRRIGIVPQDPFIFRTSLRDNLRVARPEATDDEIIAACMRASAWSFIHTLPGGLDEVVGEGGSTLSGGQRQRLAIARALLAGPPILVFDEATSALDTESEQLIQSTLESECAGRTALFIAHRLATIRRCDRVLVLEDGRIVQDGTYTDLAARPGKFRAMIEAQSLRG